MEVIAEGVSTKGMISLLSKLNERKQYKVDIIDYRSKQVAHSEIFSLGAWEPQRLLLHYFSRKVLPPIL
jgi:hypothetical protein